MSRTAGIAVLSAFLLVGSSARASIITYEGLGPDNTWGSSGNWFGHYDAASMTVAQKFTAAVSGNLEELYAAIFPGGVTTDRSYTLRLLADAGHSPGAVLWSTTSTTWPVPEGTIFHLDGIGGPWLAAGQSYWIQADKPVVMGSAHLWQINDQGYTGSVALSTNDGPWDVHDGATVRGLRVLVPEPGTAALLLMGLVCLRRRRRR